MKKNSGYKPKKLVDVGDIEFLSTLHHEGSEALYILRMLRNWMEREEREDTYHTKNMVKYWCKEADELYLGIPHENSIIPKPFKSLMQQLAEGELSYKQDIHESAA